MKVKPDTNEQKTTYEDELLDKWLSFVLKCHAAALLSMPIFIQFQWYVLLKFSFITLGLTLLIEWVLIWMSCESHKQYSLLVFALVVWGLINYGIFWIWDKIWDLEKYAKIIFGE